MADTSPSLVTDPQTCAPAPFVLHQAENALRTGLVFASPHSGSHYPQDMGSCAPLTSIRGAEDAAMDKLIEAAPSQGAPLLLATIGRAYVDLNRAANELDPALIADCDGPVPSPKTLAGYGVLHRLGGDRTPLYSRRLPLQEAITRLDTVHRPYHQALTALMQSSLETTGRALLLDWHSMPARATGPNGPDIILGDRHGSSCDAQWPRLLRSLFEAHGWRVGLNRPYAGGYATQLWGQPHDGYQALQIEVNRRLYWDEPKHAPAIGWKRCHSVLKRVIADYCTAARESL